MTAATCDGASNMMGCKTGLVTCLQECYPDVEEIASKETEIESEREIQSNRKGERDRFYYDLVPLPCLTG
jgi:hypothetical protein